MTATAVVRQVVFNNTAATGKRLAKEPELQSSVTNETPAQYQTAIDHVAKLIESCIRANTQGITTLTVAPSTNVNAGKSNLDWTGTPFLSFNFRPLAHARHPATRFLTFLRSASNVVQIE